MIEIKITAESVAQAQEEMVLLLGGRKLVPEGATTSIEQVSKEVDKEVATTQSPETEKKPTRRTKAQIEAEKAAAAAEEAPQGEEADVPEKPEAEPEAQKEPEAEPEAQKEPEAEPEAQKEPEATKTGPKIDIHKVRELIVQKAQQGKSKADIKKVLDKYGVQTLPELKDEQYPELYKDIEKI